MKNIKAPLKNQSTPTAQVMTFGCRLNHYESEVIRHHMQKGMQPQALKNTIVINTCAVTAEAERQARQAIRKTHRHHPTAQIIVTGCSAQIEPDAYMKMPGVTYVLGNQEKMDPLSFSHDALQNEPSLRVSDIMTAKETAFHLMSGFENRARAFIQIQNGCNHRCTFCTIPFGRGNNRSVPMGAIAQQVNQLIQNGCKEIVFTGVDITDYGGDLPGTPSLGQLTKRILQQATHLKRLRLSSLDPVEVDDHLFQLIQDEKRLMPHFHISLQAGHDMILKRMKRRHLRHHVVEFCHQVRQLRPDAVFGADIIAGFPTETEDMFQATLDLVDECALTYLHVFPYSPPKGTPAARMPQVPRDIIKKRAATLRAKGHEALNTYLHAQIGNKKTVLIEKDRIGYSEHYAKVKIVPPKESDPIALNPGELYPVHVIGVNDDKLMGQLIPSLATSRQSSDTKHEETLTQR